jgi:protein O-GlcNAc transferase
VDELVRQAQADAAAGQWDRARDLSLKVLEQDEENAGALHALALSFRAAGEVAAAIETMRRAIAAAPELSQFSSDLGVLLYSVERWEEAADAFQACLAAEPQNAVALHGYAESLASMGHYEQARSWFERCLAAAPNDAAVMRSLGRCLLLLGDLDSALATIKKSLTIDARSERGLLILAAVLRRQRRFEEALEVARETVAAFPESNRSAVRHATALWDAGDLSAALAERARSATLEAFDWNHTSQLTWMSLFDPSLDAKGVLAIHRDAFSRLSEPAGGPAVFRNGRERDRRLRVGYLSGDLMSGPPRQFLMPWLAAHDPLQVETFYYSSRGLYDPQMGEYQKIADHWANVAGWKAVRIAELVKHDQVDILVDLSGHFQENRLDVFPHRAAPVQVTYPHYPGTTGTESIQYILTDRWATPYGHEAEYAEIPYRLPSGYIVYDAREVPYGALPALSRGHITYGLFQRPGKLNEFVWDVIAEVLRETPNATLLVHFASDELEEYDSAQQRRFTEPLARRGIAKERLTFRGNRFGRSHLDTVAEVDIALDSFPFNGQTTTCDCLWMGVPVVSLRGRIHASRVASSILDRVGLSHLAASTPAEYVQAAVALSSDTAALASLRARLRADFVSSSLTDGTRLAREIEAAYRWMWQRWCDAG